MTDPFQRLTERLLIRLGESALLRGNVPCRVFLEHGVEFIGDYGQVTAYRTTITLPSQLSAGEGDALVVGVTSHTLDQLLSDDGQTATWWVR